LIRRLVAVTVVCSVLGAAQAQAPLLQPFTVPGATPPLPWQVAGLPNQKKPFTRFSLVDLDGRRALKVEADHSYGNNGMRPLHVLMIVITPPAAKAITPGNDPRSGGAP